MENFILQDIYNRGNVIFVEDEKVFWENCTGEGKAGVLILCADVPENETSAEFLKKIIAAVRLEFGEDTFFRNITSAEKFSLMQICRKQQIQKVLVFGLPLSGLGFNIDLKFYDIYQNAGLQLLNCESLALIENDKQRKTALWQSLKVMFG